MASQVITAIRVYINNILNTRFRNKVNLSLAWFNDWSLGQYD